MSKTPIDSADVMQKAVFQIDDGWYDAYWYSEHTAAKPRLLNRVVRKLADAIAACSSRRLGIAVEATVTGHSDGSLGGMRQTSRRAR